LVVCLLLSPCLCASLTDDPIASDFVAHSVEDLLQQSTQLTSIDFKLLARLQAECPAKFKLLYHVGRPVGCYGALTSRVPRNLARDFCQQLDPRSDLARPDAEDKNTAVIQYLKDLEHDHQDICKNDYWAVTFFTSGARYDESDVKSSFVWKPRYGPPGPMTYANWTPGRPDYSTNRGSCLVYGKDDFYRWSELGCAMNSCAVCEIPMALLASESQIE